MEYIIKPGDTLSAISARFGVTLAAILAANPQVTNPNIINAGQRITIPTPGPAPEVYLAQPGDSLDNIARRLNTTVDALLRLNPGLNPELIYPGQQIRVHPAAPPPPAAIPGCVIFLSGRTGRLEVWRSNPDGTHPLQLTAPPETPEQPVSHPRWSPDGTRFTYLSGEQLFVIDNCGRNSRQLAGNATDFSWSGDGTRLAYSGDGGSFIVDLNGNARPLSPRLSHPVWFPGDQRLAGTATIENLNYPVLATVDVIGANFKTYDQNPVVPASDVILSPDGRYAATFLFKGAAYQISAAVWIYDFSQNRLVRLPGQEFPFGNQQTIDLSFPGDWAPDSSRFIYSTLIAPNGLAEIRIANPRGEITDRFQRGYYPEVTWGPTDDWIIYAVSAVPGQAPLENTRPRNIFVRNLRTQTETQITNQGDNFSPDWNAKTCPVCS